MGSRWLNATIVLFWISMMYWLVRVQVLPSLFEGEPPSYEAMLPASDGPKTVQVNWKVIWNERTIGTAIGTITRGEDGIRQVEHKIRLREFPLPERIRRSFQIPGERRGLGVDSRMTFDDRSQLLSIHSSVSVGNQKDLIQIIGAVEGGNLLKIDMQINGVVVVSREMHLSPKALAWGQLSPLGKFSDLRVGQKWTEPVFQYFNLGETFEILHAKVERREHLDWHGKRVNTHLVVYRTDPASGLGQGGEVRKKLWVRLDGSVLQQSMNLLGNWLKFVRVPSKQPKPTDDSTESSRTDSPS